MTNNPTRYDVIAVTIAAPHTWRILELRQTKQNAEGIVKFAVMRRGVETEFYHAVPTGTYQPGDTYPKEEQPT